MIGRKTSASEESICFSSDHLTRKSGSSEAAHVRSTWIFEGKGRKPSVSEESICFPPINLTRNQGAAKLHMCEAHGFRWEKEGNQRKRESKYKRGENYEFNCGTVDERAIGNKNELLISIPADHKFFRQETTGKVVCARQKTLETFPQGLPLKTGRMLLCQPIKPIR